MVWKLNTMITRTEKVKSTVVINVKVFYKMIPQKCLSLHLITEIERVIDLWLVKHSIIWVTYKNKN